MLILLLIGSRVVSGPPPVVVKVFGRGQTQSQQRGAATVASRQKGEATTGKEPT